MKALDEPLYVLAQGVVLALDRRSGAIRWRADLGTYGGTATLLIERGELYAATKGHIYRIDPTTGRILWKNGLPGTGFGPVHMALAPAATDDPRPITLVNEKEPRG